MPEKRVASFECVLVIPAFNESASIAGALDAVARCELPVGFQWRDWFVLDDGSTDGTSQVVSEWSSAHSEWPLRVVVGVERRGKAARLEQVHSTLLAEGRLDALVVTMDADCVPEAGALARLLQPFAQDPVLAISNGLDLPARVRWGNRASAFQRRLTAAIARASGPWTPRASGRLYAYRVRALRDFHWTTGPVVDDMQLEMWIETHNLRFLSVWDAIVRVTPAASWRDFYGQTYRAFASQAAARRTTAEARRRRAHPRLRPLVAAALHDPVGAGAYLVARIVTAALHALRPGQFQPTWEVSASTKRP
ncbi:MAG: glycosyltransferase, partial [Candidatus Dormibacteraeota bacterium]|nr:glycosyltransferase [Candidatus Dormibacteraeota bacterium]